MRIHFIQHVEFEGPAELLKWAEERKYSVTISKMYNRDVFPNAEDYDVLIVMGGPMGVYEQEKYPWLIREKEFIRRSMNEQKIVIGICLGAQLIADVLDAKVYKNKNKEIGWFPIRKKSFLNKNRVFGPLEKEYTVFHWHGDTFDIPSKATRIFSSNACKNQAFAVANKVYGFQFHFEMNDESIKKIAENCKNELIEDKFIQSNIELLTSKENIQKSNELMYTIMDSIIKYR